MKASRLPLSLLLLLATTLVLSTSPAGSRSPEDPSAGVAEVARPESPLPPQSQEARVKEPTPMVAEIRAMLEAAQREREGLEERAAGHLDPASFLEVQRQIEQLHIRTELRILEIQAKHLRAAGHLEAAAVIERSIARAKAPRPHRSPVERSAPDRSAEQ